MGGNDNRLPRCAITPPRWVDLVDCWPGPRVDLVACQLAAPDTSQLAAINYLRRPQGDLFVVEPDVRVRGQARCTYYMPFPRRSSLSPQKTPTENSKVVEALAERLVERRCALPSRSLRSNEPASSIYFCTKQKRMVSQYLLVSFACRVVMHARA